ncbi:mycofactocin precursor MftA [Streptomyces sp. SID12501]|uniref:Mycofactocin n=1 Tax=Streptomyces sp. SID12501 TaxID=2706042 RepID=A0A6B3C0S1_9ACTN|nr:mycofactocin precursor MftA [Streptomyces sp. SID12501]NEC90248.1 mycofactocin precursor [Streptomyces sp. SID12501]
MTEIHVTQSVPATEIRGGETPAEESLESLIEADDLVEEISIDGMCGVY